MKASQQIEREVTVFLKEILSSLEEGKFSPARSEVIKKMLRNLPRISKFCSQLKDQKSWAGLWALIDVGAEFNTKKMDAYRDAEVEARDLSIQISKQASTLKQLMEQRDQLVFDYGLEGPGDSYVLGLMLDKSLGGSLLSGHAEVAMKELESAVHKAKRLDNPIHWPVFTDLLERVAYLNESGGVLPPADVAAATSTKDPGIRDTIRMVLIRLDRAGEHVGKGGIQFAALASALRSIGIPAEESNVGKTVRRFYDEAQNAF